MSQAMDLEGKNHLHSIDRSATSTLRDSSASYPQKEKKDVYCEDPRAGSFSPSETLYYLHAQDDYPDGGLRAWLIVLGVRSWLLL